MIKTITKILLVAPIILLFILIINMHTMQIKTQTYSREEVAQILHLGIQAKVDAGEYRCCIDPPCDMCFLGHWLWDDGACYCDDMIAKGEFDKVCPQCKNGIELGLCKSTQEDFCDITT